MRRLAFLVLLILPLTGWSGTAWAGADARTFVQEIADQVIEILNTSNGDRSARKSAYQALLSERADLAAIGRFAAGGAWRRASAVEQAEYLAAFEDYVASTFAEQLHSYSDEQLMLGRVVDLGKKGIIVYSKIESAGRQPLAIGWRIKDRSGMLKIIDITVGNVSMALTQRSEFKAVLDRNSGKLASVTAELKARTGV